MGVLLYIVGVCCGCHAIYVVGAMLYVVGISCGWVLWVTCYMLWVCLVGVCCGCHTINVVGVMLRRSVYERG